MQILLGTFHWAFLPSSRMLEKSYVHYGFVQSLYYEPAVHVEAQLQKSSDGLLMWQIEIGHSLLI
jgi:hypothetical protein